MNRPAVQRFSDLVSTCMPSVRGTRCMLLCFSILNTVCVTFCLSQRGCDCHCGIRLFTAAVHALCPRLVAVLVATTTPIKELLAGTSIRAVVETLEGSAAGSRIGLLQAILCRDEKPQSDRFFNFPIWLCHGLGFHPSTSVLHRYISGDFLC